MNSEENPPKYTNRGIRPENYRKAKHWVGVSGGITKDFSRAKSVLLLGCYKARLSPEAPSLHRQDRSENRSFFFTLRLSAVDSVSAITIGLITVASDQSVCDLRACDPSAGQKKAHLDQICASSPSTAAHKKGKTDDRTKLFDLLVCSSWCWRPRALRDRPERLGRNGVRERAVSVFTFGKCTAEAAELKVKIVGDPLLRATAPSRRVLSNLPPLLGGPAKIPHVSLVCTGDI
ncbi:unnamed protein product [Nezara viridula]|uniref:Uncharacterized protein n=1 Tax=Nezara viridula TaxID=85310 RepID=A0A9P0HBA1_NEZVI|nr:unnamed protein product [Nezara viridula]